MKKAPAGAPSSDHSARARSAPGDQNVDLRLIELRVVVEGACHAFDRRPVVVDHLLDLAAQRLDDCLRLRRAIYDVVARGRRDAEQLPQTLGVSVETCPIINAAALDIRPIDLREFLRLGDRAGEKNADFVLVILLLGAIAAVSDCRQATVLAGRAVTQSTVMPCRRAITAWPASCQRTWIAVCGGRSVLLAIWVFLPVTRLADQGARQAVTRHRAPLICGGPAG
jgi:hypothetical protein